MFFCLVNDNLHDLERPKGLGILSGVAWCYYFDTGHSFVRESGVAEAKMAEEKMAVVDRFISPRSGYCRSKAESSMVPGKC